MKDFFNTLWFKTVMKRQSGEHFISFTFLGVCLLLLPDLTYLFANLSDIFSPVQIKGPITYYKTSKKGELLTIIFIVACSAVIHLLTVLANFREKKKILLKTICIACLSVLISISNLHWWTLLFILTRLFLFYQECKNQLFLASFANKGTKPNYIYVGFLGSLFLVCSTIIFLNIRLNFFSLHMSEGTVISFFWDWGNESLLNYYPRHGLAEILLGKFLLLTDMSLASVAFITEYAQKSGSVSGFLCYSYFALRVKGFLNRSFIILLGLALQIFLEWTVFSFFVYPAIGYLLVERITMSRLYTSWQLLTCYALVSSTVFFLRIEYGLFTSIAMTISLIYFYRSKFNLIVLYIFLKAVSLFLLSLLFYNDYIWNVLSFIFFELAATNKAVWGHPPLDYNSALGLYTILNLLCCFYLGVQFFRSGEVIRAKVLFLFLFNLFFFQVITSRSDGHVYNCSIFIMVFTNIILNKSENLKLKFMVLFFLVVVTHAYQTSDYWKRISFNINPVGSWKKLSQFPDKGYSQPYYSESSRKSISKVVRQYKDQVHFLYLDPYSYVYFKTKPIGRFTDSFHPASANLQAEYLTDLSKCKVIVLNKSMVLDGVPNQYRFPQINQLLENKFELIESLDGGQVLIYKAL